MKEQFRKLKDNWLLIVLLIVVVAFMSGGMNVYSGALKSVGGGFAGMGAPEMMLASDSYARSGYITPSPAEDFAPDVQERIITKTASISAETERGKYKAAEQQLRGIVAGAKGLILNENANLIGEGWTAYYQGSYSLKIPVESYDRVVQELQGIGEMKGFSENTQDITGGYLNVQDQLDVEKGRLERYEAMMDETKDVNEKLQLTDRIYNQERTIKYLEDRLSGMDKRVEYSTISVSLTEKQSGYVQVQLVKFGQLIRAMVDSFNGLLTLAFWVFPWAVAFFVLRLVWRLFARKQPPEKGKL